MTIPVRRGTGPKARLNTFFKAFDEWHTFHEARPLTLLASERKRYQQLYQDMIEARKAITTLQGMT